MIRITMSPDFASDIPFFDLKRPVVNPRRKVIKDRTKIKAARKQKHKK